MLAARDRAAADFLAPLADMGYRGIRRRYRTYDAWQRARQIGGGLPHGPRAVMSTDGRRVLVVLGSLAAEGTPRLVLELCRIWQRDGILPLVALLRPARTTWRPSSTPRHRAGVPPTSAIAAMRATAASRSSCSGWRAGTAPMPCSRCRWLAYLHGLGRPARGVRRVAAHVGN